MSQTAQRLRRVGFRAHMVGHFLAGDTLYHFAENTHNKVCGREPGRGIVQRLVFKRFKIILVLFRGTSGIGYPVNDNRFYARQLFAGPGKGIDRQ